MFMSTTNTPCPLAMYRSSRSSSNASAIDTDGDDSFVVTPAHPPAHTVTKRPVSPSQHATPATSSDDKDPAWRGQWSSLLYRGREPPKIVIIAD
eukprot:m.62228 g.62228  ORF g.62228 m.62228 type:complete len:94 (-) comp8070_c0_seq2:185-466(-)